MENNELIPHLFRTEYSKITAVLSRHFGFEHIEIAEDIASDTFLAATELWGLKGLPGNPVAWLYAVAKNKAKNLLRHQSVIRRSDTPPWFPQDGTPVDQDIDLSDENIRDSQLQMIFAVCHPVIPVEAQIGLALRVLCGFGIGEIADAFLTNKETISKRLMRAREKLREAQVKIALPTQTEICQRLDAALRTLYLLFNEGYYSASHDNKIRKGLCAEAMRLTLLLVENEHTNRPDVHALLALMCFQSSRLDARLDEYGEPILYEDQDTSRWDVALIMKGKQFLESASKGERLSKYHLEAGIAWWHTIKESSPEKWEHILQLYNHLLQLEYSPIVALNRTYALSRANGKEEAIAEALKLKLDHLQVYHILLGELYSGIDDGRALCSLQKALDLARSAADQVTIEKKIAKLNRKDQSLSTQPFT